jgi:hypothetical protein
MHSVCQFDHTYAIIVFSHRVYRVPGFLSSRQNWLSPPSHRKRVLPPPHWFQGGDTLACGRGGGGANSDEGTDALVL